MLRFIFGGALDAVATYRVAEIFEAVDLGLAPLWVAGGPATGGGNALLQVPERHCASTR